MRRRWSREGTCTSPCLTGFVCLFSEDEMGLGGNMYTAVLALVFLCVFLSVGALLFTLWEVGNQDHCAIL